MASVLFSPITMRGLTMPNRVVVSPMCQYNSNNGSANDWHLMHLGNMALGCAGLVMCEMTNVNPQGRISPKCAGMWSDENETALKRVHDFCRQYGVAKLGVQLAHAGRKGPTTPPAAGGKPILTKEEGGRHTPFFTNYRPQFYFRTTDVTGVVHLPEGTEMVMPGDNISMEVHLIVPIAMEEKLRFAIREGGRTVGAGVVAKIIE